MVRRLKSGFWCRQGKVLGLLLAAGLVVSACGGGSAAPSAAASVNQSKQTLRVGVSGIPPAADPWKQGALQEPASFSFTPVFDTLLRSENGVLQPRLALSWKNTSPTTWQFTLRPNVKFQNGQAFTSSDVVGDVEYLRDTTAGLATSTAVEISTVTSARALGPLSVEVTTSNTDASLPNQMGAIVILPSQYWNEQGPVGFAKAPIGTGPYMVDSWSSSKVTYSAFKGAWDPAKIGNLVITSLTNASASLQALQSNEIDLDLGMDPSQIGQAKSAGLKVYGKPSNNLQVLAFCNTCNLTGVAADAAKALSDPRVRQALNYAIDKQAMIKTIYANTSSTAGSQSTEGVFGFNPAVKPFPYDPTKAKALLAEAGYPNGFVLPITAYANVVPGDVLMMDAVKANLAKIGVNAVITDLPVATWVQLEDTNGWSTPVFLRGDNPAPDYSLSRVYNNYTCTRKPAWWCDQAQSSLIAQSNSTLNSAKRQQLLFQVAESFHNNPSDIYLVTQADISASKSALTGFSTIQYGLVDWQALRLS